MGSLMDKVPIDLVEDHMKKERGQEALGDFFHDGDENARAIFEDVLLLVRPFKEHHQLPLCDRRGRS